VHSFFVFYLTPKRCSSGQLYSEGVVRVRGARPQAPGGPGANLFQCFFYEMGTFSPVFPSLAPPRNAKVGRAGLMKAAS